MTTPFDKITEPPKPPPAKRRKKNSIPIPNLKTEDKVLTPDEKEKAKLLFLIKQYQNNERLGPAIKGAVDLSGLGKLKVKELRNKVEQIDMALANHMNGGMVNGMVKQSLLALESYVTNNYNYNITGTTTTLWGDDHFLFLMERAKFKHGLNWAPEIDPLLELAILIYTTMQACHSSNKLKEVATSVDMSKPIAAEDAKALL